MTAAQLDSRGADDATGLPLRPPQDTVLSSTVRGEGVCADARVASRPHILYTFHYSLSFLPSRLIVPICVRRAADGGRIAPRGHRLGGSVKVGISFAHKIPKYALRLL